MRHHHKARDTYDQDPNTASMFDDGHVYTDTAGSIKWKFAGGPAAEYQAATGYNPYTLSQHRHQNKHHHKARDTYDQDPNTSSMYDDGHVYTDTAGSVKWKFAGGPAAEYQSATGYNPYTLSQHRHQHHHKAKDTYD